MRGGIKLVIVGGWGIGEVRGVGDPVEPSSAVAVTTCELEGFWTRHRSAAESVPLPTMDSARSQFRSSTRASHDALTLSLYDTDWMEG